MTTSSPIRKVHDIPIVKPRRQPMQLPAPDERRLVPVMPFLPEREKVEVDVR